MLPLLQTTDHIQACRDKELSSQSSYVAGQKALKAAWGPFSAPESLRSWTSVLDFSYILDNNWGQHAL